MAGQQKVISSTFNVSTVDETVSLQAQYAPNDNPTSSQIHNTWQEGDLYMRTKMTNETNWSDWHRIVGECGDETDYTFAISQYKTTSSATIAPSDISSWSDAPLAVTSAKPYLWAKVQKKSWNASTQSYDVDSTTYIRLTGEDGSSVMAQYAPNNNPSSSQIHDTWQSGDLYMRTKSTTDSNWSSWHKIVGESGDETEYTFNISKEKTSSSATTAPSNCYYNTWQDAPIAPTSTYPYLWMKVVKKTWNESTQSYDSGTPSYARVTGEKGDGAPIAFADPEILTIQCYSNGNVKASSSTSVIFSLKVANNSVTVSSVTSGTKPTGVTVTGVADNAVTITVGTTATASGLKNGVTFTVKGTYDGKEYSATVTVALVGATQGESITGPRGKIGRFFYYAQEWSNSSSVSYTVSDAEAPYFLYSNNYWVFNPSANGTYTMAEMGAPSSSSSNWKLMTNDFKYIITEALFGAYAHLGSFIINGDWMISQFGVLYDAIGGAHAIDSDTASWKGYNKDNAYTKFSPDYPNSSQHGAINFCPNFAVDGKTGETYQNDAYIRGEVHATSGEFSGTIKAGSTTIEGNLDLTDTNNGLTVYDQDSVPRINLQPKHINDVATLANDTYIYYNLSKTQSGASSFNVTTDEQSFTLAKYENLDIDKFSVVLRSSGSSGTVYPSSNNTSLTIIITHPDGSTTTKDITTTKFDSGRYRNLTDKIRFAAPVAGTYRVKIAVTNSSSWTTGQTSVYAFVNARYQTSKDTQVYIAKDGFYAHAGANKLFWAGETETQIRYGFNGIRWNDADIFGNEAMDVVADVKGEVPNAKPLWLPFYNYVPVFSLGVGTMLFTSQVIGNIGETKYGFLIDAYRNRGVCIVKRGYQDNSGNEQPSWVILPPPTFTDSDGDSVSLPYGYQITIINSTGTDIFVVPYSNSVHGAVIIDANRNNNWFAEINGVQSRDTYIYVAHNTWLSMHDTQ